MTIDVDPMFTEMVARAATEECGFDRVRDWETATDELPGIWKTFADLGLLGVGISEEAGGSGGELADVVEVIRLAASSALPIPYAEHTLLAGQWLASAGRYDPDLGVVTVVPDCDALTLSGPRGRKTLHGTARRVPWVQQADRLLIPARDGDLHTLLLVDVADLSFTPARNIANEPRDTVIADGFAVPESAFIGIVDPAGWALSGALARAVSLAGAAQSALDLTIKYVKVREQFGRPLGKFQAVGHMLALAAEDTAAARMASESAVSALSRRLDDSDWAEALRMSETDIAAAKTVASCSATTVSRLTHQMHGAMGTTVEYDLQLLTRRLWSWRDEFGSGRTWSERLGRTAIARGGTEIWDIISN
ncbi:acyl-CoA dehydrogenase family protein [Arthrobacter sp. STN4]|uniref:acyl-CoA dehydrogenase family protein n=1 Tax=Arthrobacter sp. STN4 TaxID=2923276 RepID=UPI00211A8EB3|nr:acyl-CoA dehydrogenase family protein [Arthrobacter sp. STN4]MCQ9163745.1 acyl-CoA/acyl-ACP dehydrogenase [Arthrobacter sp. STN4]